MRLDLLPTRTPERAVHVVVESPASSPVKLKFDPALGVMTLSRPLPLGLTYPFDWGFVPSTMASDGDPLDAMVLSDAPTQSGVVIACRPVGIVQLEQDRKDRPNERQRNDRVLTMPVSAARWRGVTAPSDLHERLRDELSRFFIEAVAFEGKRATIIGWDGPEAADRLIDACCAAARS